MPALAEGPSQPFAANRLRGGTPWSHSTVMLPQFTYFVKYCMCDIKPPPALSARCTLGKSKLVPKQRLCALTLFSLSGRGWGEGRTGRPRLARQAASHLVAVPAPRRISRHLRVSHVHPCKACRARRGVPGWVLRDRQRSRVALPGLHLGVERWCRVRVGQSPASRTIPSW